MRKFTGDELVIATHNAGKAREISALLSPYVSKFYTASDLDLAEPEETGATFAENAILKAQSAAQSCGKICLADDSGLAVNALHGDPGIYSARWGGESKDFNLAMKKVHEALGDMPDRSASFVCTLALGWPDGHSEVFEGRVHGNIIWPMRGAKGFGYDPVFQPDGYDITFAEMDGDAKQAISHRAKAFELLVQNCLKG
ncbi:MAG: RdgB/HAM1 family non-canonical purine NTP pyrophosphatase [Alphaproteobacteria bacterium]